MKTVYKLLFVFGILFSAPAFSVNSDSEDEQEQQSPREEESPRSLSQDSTDSEDEQEQSPTREVEVVKVLAANQPWKNEPSKDYYQKPMPTSYSFGQNIAQGWQALCQSWKNFPKYTHQRMIWNICLGFLANLYPYKTWGGTLGCNLASAGALTKQPFPGLKRYRSMITFYGVGAVAGWATKKVCQTVAPYAWAAVKRLRK